MSQEDYLSNGFRLGVMGDGRLSFWTSVAPFTGYLDSILITVP